MKQGVHDVLSPEELFNSITGLNIQGTGADFNAQVFSLIYWHLLRVVVITL